MGQNGFTIRMEIYTVNLTMHWVIIHGEYRIYHPNGKIREKGTYKLDELNGTVEKYNEDGSLYMVEQYVMGSRSGKASRV